MAANAAEIPLNERYGAASSHLIHQTRANVEAQLDALAGAGVKWVRTGFAWCDFELTEGFWYYDHADFVVNEAAERGIEILGILGGPPPWGNGGNAWNYPPTDIPAWQSYIANVCGRYKDGVSAWEVWNEENIHQFWMPEPDSEAYVTLLSQTAPSIRTADPDATVVMGGVAGLDPDYLDECLGYGAAEHVDAIAYHPYVWTLNAEYLPAEEQCRNIVLFVEWLIDQHTSKDLEIWLTEFGWTSCTEVPPGVSEDSQAAYLLRSMINYSTTSADKVFWYNTWENQDDPADMESNFGLINNDYSPKPAYNYYKRFEELAGVSGGETKGLTTSVSCSDQDTLELHSFELPDGSLSVIAWKTNDTNDSLSFILNAPWLCNPGMIDPLTGASTPLGGITRDVSGNIIVSSLTVGKTPVLLSFGPTGAGKGSIAGTVTSSSGGAIGGCAVRSYVSGYTTPKKSTTAYPSGYFLIDDLDPGNYKIFFHDPAGAHEDEWYHDKSEIYSAVLVQVEAGSTTTVNETLEAFPTTEERSDWYLAEGYTGGEFDTWVLVQNPGLSDTEVTLEFQLPPGMSAPPLSFELPAKSRQSVHLDTLPGLSNTDVSTRVSSNRQVIAERAVYFNYEGKTGGHDSVGVTAPGTAWYLAEGYTGGDFDTWVLVQNPGEEDSHVTLDFQLPPGMSAPPYSFNLPAGTRSSVHLDTLPGLLDTDVSTRVSADKPVVAERAVYFNYQGKTGGHDSIGVTAPGNNWFLAEGCTGGDFDTWVLVQNPGEEDSYVTLDFQLPPGTNAPDHSFLLPAGTRKSVHLDTLPGLANADVSTEVTANMPVVAERAVYFNYEGKTGGHDSVGVTAPGTAWYLAEGYTGGDFDTWVLVQNPGRKDAEVTLEFQLPPGKSAPPLTFKVPAGTRKSVHLDTLPGLANADVSTEVTANMPVVAERAVYFNCEGRTGGHDSVGYCP